MLEGAADPVCVERQTPAAAVSTRWRSNPSARRLWGMHAPTASSKPCNWSIRMPDPTAIDPLVQRQPERLALEGVAPAADALDGIDHAAAAAEDVVGHGDEPTVRGRDGRSLPQGAGDVVLFALRLQGAGRDKGRRRRAADAGPAMHDERALAPPGPHEGEQFFDVLGGG